jgi:hypothetical protein
MLASLTSIGLGLLVGFAWLLVWGIVLRAPIIVWLVRSPEERALRKQRFTRMGRLRFILLVGILGTGLAFALSMTVSGIMYGGTLSWRWMNAKVVFMSLSFGIFQGSISWDSHFQKEIAFPPHYPPLK